MFDKLDFITEKYDELAQKVSDLSLIHILSKSIDNSVPLEKAW